MGEATLTGHGISADSTDLTFPNSACHKVRLVKVADLLDVLRSIERSSQLSNSTSGSIPAPALPSAATVLIESREAFLSGDLADALMLATALMDRSLRFECITIENLKIRLAGLTGLATNVFDEMPISKFGNVIVRYLASISEPCTSIEEMKQRAEEYLEGPWPCSDEDEYEESITEWLGIDDVGSSPVERTRTIETLAVKTFSNAARQTGGLGSNDCRKYTPKEIRIKLGCSDTTVRNHARSAGLPARRSRGDWYSRNELLQLCWYIAGSGTSDSSLRTKAMQILESEPEAESFPKAES